MSGTENTRTKIDRRSARALRASGVLWLTLTSACAAGGRWGGVAPSACERVLVTSRNSCVAGDGPQGRAPTTVLDPEIETGVLANGMRYYVRAAHVPTGRVELRLVVKAGSEMDEPSRHGTAHFLEHMAFRRTAHFPRGGLLAELRSSGIRFGADVNASTGYDATVYRISIPAGQRLDADRVLLILGDWAHGLAIDSGDVEIERGVVLEEWRSRLGRAARLRAREDSILYAGTAYAQHDPVGDSASISRIRARDLRRFYERWYRPERMAIVVAGDVDGPETEARIRAAFEAWKRSPMSVRVGRPVSHRHGRPSIAVLADPGVTVSRVTMLRRAPTEGSGEASDFRERVADDLYAKLLGERLLELASDPAPPFGSWAITSDARQPTGRYRRVAVTAPDGDVTRALTAVLTANERIARYGFTRGEIAHGRAVLLRALVSDSAASESNERVAQAAIDHFLHGAPLVSPTQRLALTRRALASITATDLRTRASAWRDSVDGMLLVTLPCACGTGRAPATGLGHVFEIVQREVMPAHADRADDRVLLTRLPARGRIIDERQVADGQLLAWTLSNGARVLLEPTNGEPREIAVRAYGTGGLATAPDSLYASAQQATALLAAGGLGTHDAAQLSRHLAGFSVHIDAEIGEREESITARGAPGEVELLFQLLYLQLTAPRLDTVAVRAWREQRRAELERNAAEPATLIAELLATGGPRDRALTPARLDSVDPMAALRFYRERFGDASRLTFVIVGAYTPSAIRPLVTRYLASLPSGWTRSRTIERDREASGGQVVARRAVLTQPRAETFVVFRGALGFDRDSLYALESLADVLQLRLMTRLREELGGTYGVSVEVRTVPPPRSHYELTIEYESSPARSDVLDRALFDAIDALREKGPSEQEVADLAAMQRQALASAFRDDAFWLRIIEEWDRYGWPLIDEQRSLASIAWPDRELLRRAARRYLDESNLVHITLLPATQGDSVASAAPHGAHVPRETEGEPPPGVPREW